MFLRIPAYRPPYVLHSTGDNATRRVQRIGKKKTKDDV